MDQSIFTCGILPFTDYTLPEEEYFLEEIGQSAYNIMRTWQEYGDADEVRALAIACDYTHFTNNGLIPYIAEDAIGMRRYDTHLQRCDIAFEFSEMWQKFCLNILLED